METLKKHKDNLLLVALIFLVTFASFGLGRLSVATQKTTKEPVTIEFPDSTINGGVVGAAAAVKAAAGSPSTSNQVVASKSGTKYHYPWCPGASQIKEANKIYFDSPEKAEAAGYTKASNCEGL